MGVVGVLELAVLAEGLAVVGREDHERARPEPERVDALEERRDLVVGVADLALVLELRALGDGRERRRRAEELVVGRGRRVGQVHRVVVEEDEERAVEVRAHPREPAREGVVGDAAGRVVAERGRRLLVVRIESAPEPEPRHDPAARREGRGRIARVAQPLREHPMGGREHGICVERAVRVEPEARQHAHVAGQRERRRAKRVLEERAVARERVHRRRRVVLAPVDAEAAPRSTRC